MTIAAIIIVGVVVGSLVMPVAHLIEAKAEEIKRRNVGRP